MGYEFQNKISKNQGSIQKIIPLRRTCSENYFPPFVSNQQNDENNSQNLKIELKT